MSQTDPATQKEVTILKNELDGKLDKLDAQLQDSVINLMKYIEVEGDKTRQHFDTVSENMFEALKGAHQDEISLQDDTLADHAQRIDTLETMAGLR